MKRFVIPFLSCIFLLASCEYLGSAVTGHWVNQKESDEHFYFENDGRFRAVSGAQTYTGHWTPFKDNGIIISFGEQGTENLQNGEYAPDKDQILIKIAGDTLILVRAPTN